MILYPALKATQFCIKKHSTTVTDKSQIPIWLNPNPKSKLQIPIFAHAYKHELRSQNRTKPAIHQCHCQCYSTKCLKCLGDCHSRSSSRRNSCCLQLKPVNSTGETTKHWKELIRNIYISYGTIDYNNMKRHDISIRTMGYNSQLDRLQG